MQTVEPLSVRALRIECLFNDQLLGTASGFVVIHEGNPFLITNWHVVTGRNADTGSILNQDTASIPNRLNLRHHTNLLGTTVSKIEVLYTSDGCSRWIEHPQGRAVDVVALPLENLSNIQLYPFELSLANTDIIPRPGMPVFIIGFPFGLSAGEGFGIWKTGHIASDPDIDVDSRPYFLVDATTRGGMSGAPAILRLSGGYETSTGFVLSIVGSPTKFLGIYSGRVNQDSELGRIWKPHVLSSIFNNNEHPVQTLDAVCLRHNDFENH
ncbi:MAG: hypothetical protein C7B46_17690 [Sulfobacillus benefaciens]|uniref:Serine protease n=1 Tax=Sulfobacillus benefaciens TaxID=453960 RepID=A0A2T2X7X8_9FIRM|nr:MAG: hypothetical protein C7B46_17690 [Sulfobacillus benefaciens]